MFYLQAPLIIFGCGVILFLGGIVATILWKHPDNTRRIGYFYARWIAFVLGIKVTVQGRQNLAPRGVVYVVNHQSALDAVPLGFQYIPRSVYMGKKSLLYIPIFGFVFYVAGNILIDRKDAKKAMSRINKGVRRIKKGASVVIFPEGTRNKKGTGILRFKRGAFLMAIKAGVPIVPIVNSPFKRYLDWGSRTTRRGAIVSRVLPAVSTAGLKESDAQMLAEKIRLQMEEQFKEMARATDNG